MKKCILLLFLIFSLAASSQHRCGTVEFNQSLPGSQELHSRQKFEEWLLSKKLSRRLRTTMDEVYEIPVVFHIIHNGETVGFGANISNSRINEQMISLNEDFRRENDDADDTPAEFLDDAADTHIQFVLAQRDPEGLPTTGIVRYEGPQSSYEFDDANLISSLGYWPSDEYLNVWVANFSDVLGFAQFPIADLDGLNGTQDLNATTDGTFVDYRYLGNNNIGTAFPSRGRTLTHEVGHWIGLRHIWGDGGCSVDDFCSDTPTQGNSSSGCPAEETNSCNIGQDRMYQNYMDYTDDLCMNIFTVCQSDRMRTVLESSPRRNALLSSKGGTAAIQVANDLGIRSIVNPMQGNCNLSVLPEIEVRNYGTNDVTSFSIQLLISDVVIETKNVNDLLLAPGDIGTVTFNTVDFSDQVLTAFKVTQVNNSNDGNDENDCKWIATTFPSSTVIPLVESFEDPNQTILETWSGISSNTETTLWSFGTAPAETPNNRAAILPYASSSTTEGYFDLLMTPAFNLTGILSIDISFKYAYSANSENFSDGLFLFASTDCGTTFDFENPLFTSWSPSLSTVSEFEANFVPSDENDWLTVELLTTDFVNEENVVFAFAGLNGGGNNLYIDDILITSDQVNNNDASITDIVNLPVVSCLSDFQSSVEVKNLGVLTLNDLTISYRIGSTIVNQDFSSLGIESGKTGLLPISFTDIPEGANRFNITLSSPNGAIDDDVTNNLLQVNFELNLDSTGIPFREQFIDPESYDKWSFARQDSATDLSVFALDDDNEVLFFNGYTNTAIEAENWFVSPSINLANLDSASFSFEVSYAYRADRNDRLQVFASTDCGRTYDSALYDKSGRDLAVLDLAEAWVPDREGDWIRETIELSQYAGESELQIAFKITNQNGNNLYIDNIEFFDLATPYEVEIEKTLSVYPNPVTDSFRILFNFNIKEDITIRLMSLNGEVKFNGSFPNTLNQLYQIENLDVPSGIYILQVRGNNTNLRERIVFL